MSLEAEDNAPAKTAAIVEGKASEQAPLPVEITSLRVTPDSDGVGGGVTLELRTAGGTSTFHLGSTQAGILLVNLCSPTAGTCRQCRGTGKAENARSCLQCGGRQAG